MIINSMFLIYSSKYIINFIIIILISLFILIICELLTRIWILPAETDPKKMFEYDSIKLFRLKPDHMVNYGGSRVVTNSNGMRDDQISNHKTNEFRILLLGDSVSFGQGVAINQSYSKLLETYRIDKSSINVINTACPGNSINQELADLERNLLLNPDLVLLQVTPNDFTSPMNLRLQQVSTGTNDWGFKDLHSLDFWLKYNSALYGFISKKFTKYKMDLHIDDNDLRNLTSNRESIDVYNLIKNGKSKEVVSRVATYFRTLDRLNQIVKKNRLKLVILFTPHFVQFMAEEDAQFIQEEMFKWASDNNILYLDFLHFLDLKYIENMSYMRVRPYSIKEKNKFWSTFFIDHVHLSPNGHKEVSAFLFNAISEDYNNQIKSSAENHNQ